VERGSLFEVDPGRHRDLVGRDLGPWVRRAGFAILSVFIVLGLLDVFGQRPQTSTAVVPAASLEISSPESLRGGLLYQARFQVSAHREIREPKLVLSRGWLDGLTVNTVEPQAKQEASDNGKLVLSYDTIPAGRSLIVWVQYQVNPTTVGERAQPVDLYDGTDLIVHAKRSLRVFP
jgi:hypothetical protein